MSTPAICIAHMGSLPSGSTWNYEAGHLAVRPFDDEADAALFKLKYSAKATPVWMHMDEHGHLAFALSSARQYWAEITHRRDADISVSREKLNRILLLLDTKKWTSEADVADVVSLTRYEWASLKGHEYFNHAQRKFGWTFQLSMEGERAQRRVLAQRLREEERHRHLEESHKRFEQLKHFMNEDFLARLELERARTGSPPSVIHLPDRSGLKFGLPAVIQTEVSDQ